MGFSPQCLYSAGCCGTWLSGVPGAGSTRVHLLESHILQGQALSPRCQSRSSIGTGQGGMGEAGCTRLNATGGQPSELVDSKAEVSLLLLFPIPLRSCECPLSFAKVRDSPLQAVLSFLLVAMHHLRHLSHYVHVWPLVLSRWLQVQNSVPFALLLEIKEKILLALLYMRAEGPEHQSPPPGRGQQLTASLSQGTR